MDSVFTIAITGDCVINKRISVYTEERFLSLVKVIRDADVAYTHFEGAIHDYDGPEVYPAAEPGWTWLRSPHYVAEELKWAGLNIISLAGNHCLDYSYGGLTSTWKALNKASLPHAGTGRNLGGAREPTYLETRKGRVALISMCSTFAGWGRAGEARPDMKGRPGLNSLRYYYLVDTNTMEATKQLAIKLGWWVRQVGKMWLLHPAGLHHNVYKFMEREQPGISTAADEDDAEGNLRSIRQARRQADWVIVHLHTHEWNPDRDLSVPADFVPSFARACIDDGADVFVADGSHAGLRGVELYKSKPIFYDPGTFMGTGSTVTKLPADFYSQVGFSPEVKSWKATPADAFEARNMLPQPLNPPGGYHFAPLSGSIVGMCSFGENRRLTDIRLYPIIVMSEPHSHIGLPMLADAEKAKDIIEYIKKLSFPFGTEIEFQDGIGIIRL